MRIEDIIPYEKNARHNEKAIPKVAESIRQFGLRGSIVLESKDNPVIVTGHTRVAAMKSLGWTEVPDDHIEYCDGLSKDEIDAFRIVDNKTGEISTWNIALLKAETKRLNLNNGKLDFTKYGFKPKNVKPYGAERERTGDYYNLTICDRTRCIDDGYPLLSGTEYVPTDLLGFNYAKSDTKPEGKSLHFFLDDYQFERLWNNPQEYTPLLRKYESVLTPDWSLYRDMPLPMQAWNIYRARAIGDYWEREGLTVIPTLSWSDRESFSFCFKGIPKDSTVAVSTVGVKNDTQAWQLFKEGMWRAIQEVQPSHILLYGGNIDFDFKNIPVTEYANSVTTRWAGKEKRD